MIERVVIKLPGAPVAKGRPRFGNGRAYTDAKTIAAEQSILAAWLTQAGARKPHDGPVAVEIVATFIPPASWPKWKQQAAVNGLWPHMSKPDSDNLAKAVLDALNGVAWVDDAQVVRHQIEKQYHSTAYTFVAVTFYDMPTKGQA